MLTFTDVRQIKQHMRLAPRRAKAAAARKKQEARLSPEMRAMLANSHQALPKLSGPQIESARKWGARSTFPTLRRTRAALSGHRPHVGNKQVEKIRCRAVKAEEAA